MLGGLTHHPDLFVTCGPPYRHKATALLRYCETIESHLKKRDRACPGSTCDEAVKTPCYATRQYNMHGERFIVIVYVYTSPSVKLSKLPAARPATSIMPMKPPATSLSPGDTQLLAPIMQLLPR